MELPSVTVTIMRKTPLDVVVPLDELLELAGLGRLRGKVAGQAEGGEQPVGFEEGIEAADPPA